jgi:hypothetical protein
LLRSVLENYIDTFSEREFDIPFLSLLLFENYYDLHFIHGNYEFGKDFIAKKIENGTMVQYVFQSKAGDINLDSWRDLRTQIDEMRTNLLAHPNYDKNLLKKVEVIITGRLIGGASLSAQEYDRYLKDKGELGFSVWDKDTIIEKFFAIESWATELNKSTDDFLILIGSLRKNGIDFKKIEDYSRNWLLFSEEQNPNKFFQILLEASLINHELLKYERNTLSCYVDLMIIRALLYALYDVDPMPEKILQCLYLSIDSFEYHSKKILLHIEADFLTPDSLLTKSTSGIESFITYPVLCLQIIEIIGLLGLLILRKGDIEQAKKVAANLEIIINNNCGCSHPISDKYAVSYIPAVILLSIFNKITTCEKLLHDTAIWVLNRYEESEFGLASSNSTEYEEIETLIGYMFDFVELRKRRNSYLLTVILDLVSILGLSELYQSIINDVLALEIYPCLIDAKDNKSQFKIDGDSCFYLSLNYKEEWKPLDGWRSAPHHYNEPYLIFKKGFWWESLAVNSVLRDRHRPSEIREIINLKTSLK